MECSNLRLDLVEQILSCLPLKSRTRMRCVSKSWCGLITRLDPESIASSGIVVSPPRNQAIVLATSNPSGDCIRPALVDVTLRLPESAVLVDSCNGLLLYAVINDRYYDELYVVSPMSNQFLRIPRGCHGKICDTAFVGLAFDGEMGQNSLFKVICYVPEPEVVPRETWIDCQIFNSGDGQWRSRREKIFHSRVRFKGARIFWPRVYRDGKMYCLWDLWTLIHDVEKNVFRGAQTPSMGAGLVYPHCLWLSEGRLHCFVKLIAAFEMYVYVNDDDDDHGGGEGKWVRECVGSLDISREATSEIQQATTQQELKKIARSFRRAKRMAFSSELKILYLCADSVLFSYCFETQCIKIAGRLDDCGAASADRWAKAAIQCLRLNSVDLSHIGGSCQY